MTQRTWAQDLAASPKKLTQSRFFPNPAKTVRFNLGVDAHAILLLEILNVKLWHSLDEARHVAPSGRPGESISVHVGLSPLVSLIGTVHPAKSIQCTP